MILSSEQKELIRKLYEQDLRSVYRVSLKGLGDKSQDVVYYDIVNAFQYIINYNLVNTHSIKVIQIENSKIVLKQIIDVKKILPLL